MGLQQVFCMIGGTGEASYANNSNLQKIIISKVVPLLEESVVTICSATEPKCLTIADLGCSSGPNALVVLQSIVNVSVSTCQNSGIQIPEFNVLMNDLPRNDFNTIFKSLPRFYKKLDEEKGVEIPCFISGTPGSFYGRLFPCKSVHLMYSFTSLHWLSQVPEGLEGLNNGCIYARKTSPCEVLKAYEDQYRKDFTLFLRCRSKEIVHGGRMVLTFMGGHGDEVCPLAEFTGLALNKLAFEGMIDKEKVDRFNLPYYRASIQQVEELIEAEGSFGLQKLHTVVLPWNVVATSTEEADFNKPKESIHPSKAAKLFTMTVRAAQESLLASEFGDRMTDIIFDLVQEMVMNSLTIGQEFNIFSLAVSLIRKA